MAAAIDRQKTTPFLLKLFYRQNTFHRLDEFHPGSSLPQHLQIYTWPTCSLRELTHLVTSAMPQLLPKPAAGTRIAFRLIYPDTRPQGRPDAPARFMSRELGSVVVGGAEDAANGDEDDGTDVRDKLGGDAEKQLQDARFIIGDYISCVIVPPLANGAVAPAPALPAQGPPGRSYGGPPRGGSGSYGRRGGMRAFGNGDYASGPPERGSVPSGDWRRGERVPDAPYRGRGGRGRW